METDTLELAQVDSKPRQIVKRNFLEEEKIIWDICWKTAGLKVMNALHYEEQTTVDTHKGTACGRSLDDSVMVML